MLRARVIDSRGRVPGFIDMSYASKSVAAFVGLLVMAIVFSRQLFLFTAFRDPQGFVDPQGARHHLLLSLVAAVIACIAGALMFYFFGRHRRNDSSQTMGALRERVAAVPNDSGDHAPITPPATVPFSAVQWAQLNPWLSEGQSDDRRPMDGSVADSERTSSGQRTLARESHQLKFKKWSQARRD
ncbi:MAG: hypothetical protein ND895_07320 [Pyrinomonadaceae bacterium]|nr:hypothetical protein [Pyrinomonadaceae bacterium]